MVGGEEKAVEECLPFLQTYSRDIKHFGKAGKGQHAKAVNQTMVAGQMIGICEGLIYAHKAGLPLD